MARPLIKFSFAFVFVCALLVSSSAQLSARKLIVLTANRLTLHNIYSKSYTNLFRLTSEGASALLSPNCAGKKREESLLLTASSGCPMKVDETLKDIRVASETYSKYTDSGLEFALRTGSRPSDESGVVLNIAVIERLNRQIVNSLQFGLIGDSCKLAGKRITALGNADYESFSGVMHLDRSTAVLASDSHGVIDQFYPVPKDQHAAPLGIFSDPNTLVQCAIDALKENDVLILCFGDLVQLDNMRQNVSIDEFAKLESQALKNLDISVGLLMEECEKRDAVLAVVSFGLPESLPWNQLTPVFVYGIGNGSLTSFSTKTPGLITVADFAPSILQMAQIPAARGSVGRPASVVLLDNNLDRLVLLNKRVQVNASLLAPVGITCGVLVALVMSMMTMLMAFKIKVSCSSKAALRFAMLALMAIPLAMLVAVCFPPGAGWYIGTMLVFSLVIAWGAMRIADKGEPKAGLAGAIVFGVSAFVFVLDAYSGSKLCRFALPSSYQLSGMRYYGIGNEYAAFLTGMFSCAILYALAFHKERLRLLQWAVIFVGIAILVALGWGSFGANYGATASAAATFVLLWIVFRCGKFSWVGVMLALVIGLSLSVLFSELDAAIMKTTGTHAGQIVNLATGGGAWPVMDILVRKVVFNLRILGSKQTLLMVLAFAPFGYLWFRRLRSVFDTFLVSDTSVKAGYAALAVGSSIALALNDSGVVMAAIILTVMLSSVLLALFEMEGSICRE